MPWGFVVIFGSRWILEHGKYVASYPRIREDHVALFTTSSSISVSNYSRLVFTLDKMYVEDKRNNAFPYSRTTGIRAYYHVKFCSTCCTFEFLDFPINDTGISLQARWTLNWCSDNVILDASELVLLFGSVSWICRSNVICVSRRYVMSINECRIFRTHAYRIWNKCLHDLRQHVRWFKIRKEVMYM